MTILLKGGSIVNVFSNEILRADVLISDNKIIGVGDYSTHQADSIVDLTGKFLCPGLIDGHIHIESTMMLPYELSKACLPCGTTTIIADPHEIANVCGKDGINFMIEQSKGLPFDVFFMLPSCVPATNFDETGAKLDATDLNEFYSHPRVLGLAEMMNYVGVCKNDDSVMAKIEYAKQNKKIINGHAPLLCGKDLDKYISVGIQDDHECSNFDEALEKLRKGQKIMIRQGSTAKNLISLLPLFDSNFADRCMLVSDDKHPSDFLEYGHIDSSIRLAIKNGKNIISAIKMATIVPAQHFGLSNLGAIAPGYSADIVVFDSTENFNVLNVYKNGKLVVNNGKVVDYDRPQVSQNLIEVVKNSVHVSDFDAKDFFVTPSNKKARVIKLIKNDLISEEFLTTLDFTNNNGIDISNDITKIAVIERHKGTGHIGLGYVKGIGLKKGAIASTVAHDSHNLIVIGANDNDMAVACNHISKMGGGCICVCDGKVIGSLPLPIAGLMTELSAQETASLHDKLIKSVRELGVPEDISPFMAMAFLSLPVIPFLKLTTLGLIDVVNQKIIDLFE